MQKTNKRQSKSRVRGAALISIFATFTIVVVLIVALGILSWRTILPGNVGIVFDKATHSIKRTPLEPGWALINPFTQFVQQYPITIQTYSMVYRSSTGQRGDDSIKVQSREGQQLNLDVVIQYRIKKEEVADLYDDWGGADMTLVEERVVRQYTRSQVPAITAQYDWEEVVSTKRTEISELIRESLTAEFSRRHMELISFGIREVHLPGSLQKALNTKIQAQQAAEQQKYQLDQAKVKADQALVEAEGEANAMRARVQAEAEANEILARSLTPELIRYKQLQQWDGRLPIFQGNNFTPMLDASSVISGGIGY